MHGLADEVLADTTFIAVRRVAMHIEHACTQAAMLLQDTNNSLTSFARLYHHPCNNLLSIIALYALRHWHRFKPPEIAGLLWSLALLRGCPVDTWKLLLESLAQMPAASFDVADLHQLYQMYLLLDSSSDACRPNPSAPHAGMPAVCSCCPAFPACVALDQHLLQPVNWKGCWQLTSFPRAEQAAAPAKACCLVCWNRAWCRPSARSPST